MFLEICFCSWSLQHRCFPKKIAKFLRKPFYSAASALFSILQFKSISLKHNLDVSSDTESKTPKIYRAIIEYQITEY